MKHLVIALDGDRAVATTFSSDGKRLRFDGARHYSSGSSAEFAAGLDEIAAMGPYRDVTLLLDPDKVFARHITHPLRDRRHLREILPLELKGETAVDADQLAFEALPLSGGRVLALWTRRHDLREKIDALTRAGLEPRVVTVPGCGWEELVPSAQCHGITDGRTLAVFANGEPVLLRAIGADIFHELQRSLAALEVSCERLDALYLTGSVHNLPPMSLHDIDAVPLPVEGALDAAFSGGFESARVHAGAFAAAHTALTRDCVNFRHGEFAYTADLQAFRRSLRKTAVLAGILAVLVVGRYGFKMYQVNKDISSLDLSITRIYREVFPTRSKAADPVGEVASEIRRLGDGGSASSLLVVLNRLAEAKTDDISAVYEIEADGPQLRVKGDARSIDAVSGFRTRLAASFADVEQGETKSRPNGGVTFAFRATVKEGEQ